MRTLVPASHLLVSKLRKSSSHTALSGRPSIWFSQPSPRTSDSRVLNNRNWRSICLAQRILPATGGISRREDNAFASETWQRGSGKAGRNRKKRSYDAVASVSHTLPRQLLLARSGASGSEIPRVARQCNVPACTLCNIILSKWRGGITPYDISFAIPIRKPDSKGTINTCLPSMLLLLLLY